jgi:hypothetical protein
LAAERGFHGWKASLTRFRFAVFCCAETAGSALAGAALLLGGVRGGRHANGENRPE